MQLRMGTEECQGIADINRQFYRKWIEMKNKEC